jgi:hypothetical protein
VKLQVPDGWTAEREDGGEGAAFRVTAAEVEALNDLEVTVRYGEHTRRASFRVLGPQEATGYPAAQNVPTCPTCHGMQGYCLCEREQQAEPN